MIFGKAWKTPYMRKRFLAVLLAATLGISGYEYAAASSIKDAEKKKTEAQNNLDEVNRQIQEIQSAQSSLQSEMAAYDNQLMNLLTDMEILKSDMETQEQEIEQANADLDAARIEEQQQYESMKLRIQYMYENGNKSLWEALVGAEDVSDLLNRVEYVSDVYEYDRQMLIDYQNVVQQVEDLTEQLNNEMAEMEELQLSYEEQEASLEQVIAAKRKEMANFDSKLSNAQSLASQYAKTIRQQNDIIASEKAKQEAAAKAAAEKAKKSNAGNGTTTTSGTSKTGGTDSQTGESGGQSGGTGSQSGGSGGSSTTGLTDGGLNPSYSTGVSGSDVVAYASQFLGNPYVMGGNSLTNGTDCSYFVMAVYQHFGISLPRSSYEQSGCGKAVSYENAQPGDIICYPGHVAIYIGGGRIIHASNPTTGICYGNATYRTITSVRRVL